MCSQYPSGFNITSRNANHCHGPINNQGFHSYQQSMSHFPTANPAALYQGGPNHLMQSNNRHREQALNYPALSHYPPWPSQGHSYQMMASNQRGYNPMTNYGVSWPTGIGHHQAIHDWPHGGQDSFMRSLAGPSPSVNSSNHTIFPALSSSNPANNTHINNWPSHHKSSSSNHPTHTNHSSVPSEPPQNSASFNQHAYYQNYREGSSSSSNSRRHASSNHGHQSSGSSMNLNPSSVAQNSSASDNPQSHCSGWRNLSSSRLSQHISGPGSTHSESSSNHSTSPFGVLPHQETTQVGGPGSASSGYYSSSASSTGSAPSSCMLAPYGHVGHNGLPDATSSVPGASIAGGETTPNLSGVLPEDIEFPPIVGGPDTLPTYEASRLEPSAASSSSVVATTKVSKNAKSDRAKSGDDAKKREKKKERQKKKEMKTAEHMAYDLFPPPNFFQDFMHGQHGYPAFQYPKGVAISHQYGNFPHNQNLMPNPNTFNTPLHHYSSVPQHYSQHHVMNGELALNSTATPQIFSSHMQSQPHHVNNNKTSHNQPQSLQPQHDHESQSPHGSVASSHASMEHVMDKSQQQTVQSQIMQQTPIPQMQDHSQSSHGSLTPHQSVEVPEKSHLVPSPRQQSHHAVQQRQNFSQHHHPPSAMSSLCGSNPGSVNDSQNGLSVINDGQHDHPKEAIFQDLEDDLRLLTEGATVCSAPSSTTVNNMMPNDTVRYTPTVVENENKACMAPSGNSVSTQISNNSKSKSKPSLAETDPDFKKILDLVDGEVIQSKPEVSEELNRQPSPTKRPSSCINGSGASTVFSEEQQPPKKKKKKSSKEKTLPPPPVIPALPSPPKVTVEKEVEVDTKFSKILDFKDIPIISRVEVSKPLISKSKVESEKKTKSSDSKFFKNRPQTLSSVTSNPVIEIEPLSNKNQNSKNTKTYESSKKVTEKNNSRKKKGLSSLENKINSKQHDEYEFKDSPCEPAKKKNTKKKEVSATQSTPILNHPVISSNKTANSKKPLILTAALPPTMPTPNQSSCLEKAKYVEKVHSSLTSLPKKCSSSQSKKNKDITGVLSHLQPIAPKIAPQVITPKCTTNIPIFIPASVPSLVGQNTLNEIKGIAKAGHQAIPTAMVTLNTITVPVVVSESNGKNEKLCSPVAAAVISPLGAKNSCQVSPQNKTINGKKAISKLNDSSKSKETSPCSNGTSFPANHSSKSKAVSSVGVQSMGTNTPRRRSQDKKSATIREGLMRTQDFVVPIEDMSLENPIIWRIEGKALLQKFEPSVQPDGSVIYTNTSSYSAWNPTVKQKFRGVDVRVMASTRTKITVEKIGITEIKTSSSQLNGDSVSVDKVKEPSSQGSTADLQDNFEVFLQTLISQVLDSNFISEIVNENDDYFITNVQTIEEYCLRKKTKFFTKVKWDANIIKCVESYPIFSSAPQKNEGDLRCRLCHDSWSTQMLSFTGSPYDPITLESRDVVPNITGDLNGIKQITKYASCDLCKDRVALFSRLHHQKHHFFTMCQQKVNELRAENEDKESYVIIEECFQDIDWVEKLYKELECIWSECDRIR